MKNFEGIESIIPDALSVVVQRATEPLYFDFLFKPGHPSSEALKAWFEEHNIDYYVSEYYPEGFIESGGVSFCDNPDLAVLFKLRFV